MLLLHRYSGPMLWEGGQNPPGGVTPSNPPVVTFGDQIVYKDAPATIDPVNTGGAATSASLQAGTLPSGMSLDTDGTATGTIGRIYGTPDTVETQSGIVIRLTNADGFDDSPAFSIDAQEAPVGSGGGVDVYVNGLNQWVHLDIVISTNTVNPKRGIARGLRGQ